MLSGSFRVKVSRRSRLSPSMRIVLVSIPIRVAPCSSPAGIEMGNPRNIWARVSPPGVNDGRKGKTVEERGKKSHGDFSQKQFHGRRDSEKRLPPGEGGGGRAVKERTREEIDLPAKIIRVVIFLENVLPPQLLYPLAFLPLTSSNSCCLLRSLR